MPISFLWPKPDDSTRTGYRFVLIADRIKPAAFDALRCHAGEPPVDGHARFAVDTVDRQDRPLRIVWSSVLGAVCGVFEDGTSEFTIPDCGHPIDCADRQEEEGLYGRVRVAGPGGEWRCHHIEHGNGGMRIPKFADQQP